MTQIFEPLIGQLEGDNSSFSEPQSFLAYVENLGIKPKDTAKYISVQQLSKLSPELRDKGYTVFRLGSHKGVKGSFFALAKLLDPSDWSEYFLIDQKIFDTVESEIFLPNVSIRQLFAFDLLSKLTENSLINLAISSGLMASALNIETSESLAAPASGQGTFSFSVKPSNRSETIWLHESGQVEIDALFVGRREGRETLFVIEAKHSNSFESLAKYKLIYPVLAVESKVPKSIPIIPVYLRTIKHPGKRFIDFYIAECTGFNRKDSTFPVNSLNVASCRHFTLMGFKTD
jgi:hypothetical protein